MSIINWHMNVIKRCGLNPLDIYANFWCQTCGKGLNFIPSSPFSSYCEGCKKWWEDNAPIFNDVKYETYSYRTYSYRLE